jgi:TRAP-type C4-dicarboxylate transport system permease small subunit
MILARVVEPRCQLSPNEPRLTGAASLQLARFDAGLCFLNRWVLVVLLAVMVALVALNVFARYAMNHSIPWVEELSRYMMIWLTFLGAGPALRSGSHIAVESLPAALPASPARWLRGAIAAVIAATLIIMAWLGWEYADFAWEQESPVLNWSLGKIYLALPIGSVLTLLHLLFVAPSWIRGGEWEKQAGFSPQAI